MHATAIPEIAKRNIRPLRIVVMGTGPFAVPMFQALVQSPHEIVGVVTRPNRAAAGRRPPTNPLREAAMAAGLSVLDPERVNDDASVEAIRRLAPDLLVVCDYGQILSPGVLGTAAYGGINLHGSLLPRHRGAAPVQWAILEGDPITGVSVIRMTPTLDAGVVLVARATPVYPRETASQLEHLLAELGAGATLEAIERLQAAKSLNAADTQCDPSSDDTIGTPQNPLHATRAPRLTKADGIVDWSLPAARLERMQRAMDPWPRIATFLAGRISGHPPLRLVLEDVDVAGGDGAASNIRPGTVLAAGDDGIVVACGEGTSLVIRRLVPEGRRSMSAAEFLRGHSLLPGTILSSGSTE